MHPTAEAPEAGPAAASAEAARGRCRPGAEPAVGGRPAEHGGRPAPAAPKKRPAPPRRPRRPSRRATSSCRRQGRSPRLGHSKVVALVTVLMLSLGCASLRWSLQKAFREEGDRLESFPEEVWEEYDCETQKRPFFIIEKNELVPPKVKVGGEFNHRMVYVMCPVRPTAVVAGRLRRESASGAMRSSRDRRRVRDQARSLGHRRLRRDSRGRGARRLRLRSRILGRLATSTRASPSSSASARSSRRSRARSARDGAFPTDARPSHASPGSTISSVREDQQRRRTQRSLLSPSPWRLLHGRRGRRRPADRLARAPRRRRPHALGRIRALHERGGHPHRPATAHAQPHLRPPPHRDPGRPGPRRPAGGRLARHLLRGLGSHRDAHARSWAARCSRSPRAACWSTSPGSRS